MVDPLLHLLLSNTLSGNAVLQLLRFLPGLYQEDIHVCVYSFPPSQFTEAQSFCHGEMIQSMHRGRGYVNVQPDFSTNENN